MVYIHCPTFRLFSNGFDDREIRHSASWFAYYNSKRLRHTVGPEVEVGKKWKSIFWFISLFFGILNKFLIRCQSFRSISDLWLKLRGSKVDWKSDFDEKSKKVKNAYFSRFWSKFSFRISYFCVITLETLYF